MAQYVTDSGRTVSTNWQETEAIIKEFAPEWQQNQQAVIERLLETMQAVRGGLMAEQMSRSWKSEPEITIKTSYHYQQPRLEHWGVGEKKEPTLTFQINGERFVLRQGVSLQIYRNGMSQKITRRHLEALGTAVKRIKDRAAKAFFTSNILHTHLEE
jgi:hypothetical protein